MTKIIKTGLPIDLITKQGNIFNIFGYLAVYKNLDYHNHILKEGLFDHCSKFIKKMPMYFEHDYSFKQIGFWYQLKSNDYGLYCHGSVYNNEIINKIKNKEISGLSVAFKLREYYKKMNDDKEVVIITKGDLYEGSVVKRGANPKAIIDKYKFN